MSRLPLDEIREQVAAENRVPGRGRRVLVLALIALGVGLLAGYLAFQAMFIPPVPQTIDLSCAEQDDYILMIAEAYAVDRDADIAQQRLSRLNDSHITDESLHSLKNMRHSKIMSRSALHCSQLRQVHPTRRLPRSPPPSLRPRTRRHARQRCVPTKRALRPTRLYPIMSSSPGDLPKPQPSTISW